MTFDIKWRKDGYGTQRAPRMSKMNPGHVKIWFLSSNGHRYFVDRADTMKKARERIARNKELVL